MAQDMQIKIDARRVAQVAKEINDMLAQKGYTYIDALLALSEMAGRMVVTAAENEIQAKQLAAAAFDHLSRTITIGMAHKQGESRIARV